MHPVLRGFLTLLFVAGTLSAVAVRSAGAQSDGYTYVSPHFGHRLSWDASWYVLGESAEEGHDEIGLTNGGGLLVVQGLDIPGDPRLCLTAYASFLEAEFPDNFQEMTGADGQPMRGSDTTSAFAVYSYTQVFEDGSSLDVAGYLTCRTLVPGESMVNSLATIPLFRFEEQLAATEQLLANLVLTPPGEPGPVVVHGPWRVAVAGAARHASQQEFGLTQQDDAHWLIVVADVANDTAEVQTLRPDEFGIALAGADEPIALAVDETAEVAATLSSQPTDPVAGLELAPAEIRRLVLVFQIPDDAQDPALIRKGASLPLDQALDASTSLHVLRPVIAPAPQDSAEIVGVGQDGTLDVLYTTTGESATIRLAGLDLPAGDACFAEEAAERLDSLVGDAVLLESDPAAADDARYVWTTKRDGTKVLVNKQFAAGGFATLTDAAAAGRFGAWLTQAEAEARAASEGLWAGCTDQGAATPTTSEDEANEPSTDTASLSLDGTWSGTLDGGGTTRFTITDDGLVSMAISYSCTAGSSTRVSFEIDPPMPIDGDAFTYSNESMLANLPSSVQLAALTITATFDGPDSASGLVEISGDPNGCDAVLAWTATKA